MAAPDDAEAVDAEAVDASVPPIHPGPVNAHTQGVGDLCKGYSDRRTLGILLAGGDETAEHPSLELRCRNPANKRRRVTRTQP